MQNYIDMYMQNINSYFIKDRQQPPILISLSDTKSTTKKEKEN